METLLFVIAIICVGGIATYILSTALGVGKEEWFDDDR